MLHLRITTPSALTEQVLEVFAGDPAVSSLAVLRAAAVKPPGDVVLADVAREAANEVVDRLDSLGVPQVGTLHVEAVDTWMSQAGFESERDTPGSSADAVVWADVTHRAYQESELNWTYLSFMTLATLLAGVAIIVDSQILIVGAMVLGPEFVAISALGLALVRRRRTLFFLAARTLLLGFGAAIAIATVASLGARSLGWIVSADVTGERPGTDFIYTPDRWSFIVALIAAAAGVLSLTSARVGGLSGVFISVTTVPAAANVALGLAFTAPGEIWASTIQLLLNVTGMAIAGWATLAFQQAVWTRKAKLRRRELYRRRT